MVELGGGIVMGTTGQSFLLGAMAAGALTGCNLAGGGGGHGSSAPSQGALPAIDAAVGSAPVDLAIAALHHHPDSVGAADLEFHFYVYNHSPLGVASAPSSWQLYLDGVPFTGAGGSGSLPAIAADRWVSVSTYPRSYPSGTHLWTVIIDAHHENVENDENDNRASILIVPGRAESPATIQGVQAADPPVAVAGDPNAGVDLIPVGLHYHPSPAFGDEGAVTPESIELHWWTLNHSSDGRTAAASTWRILVDGQPFAGANGSGSTPAVAPDRWQTTATYPRDAGSVKVPTGPHTWTVVIDNGDENAETDEANDHDSIVINVVPVAKG
jgi:hypothetical protein